MFKYQSVNTCHISEFEIYEFGRYQESDVVGLISLSYSSEDCAEIDHGGKSFQGQGIGRELITTIGDSQTWTTYRSKQSEGSK